MQKRFNFIALFCFTLTIFASAQTTAPLPAYRHYATQMRLRQLQSLPGVLDSMAAIERFTTDFRRTGQMDTVSVAIVFQLMPLPDGETPPNAADLQTQLERLNIDFFNPEHPYLGASYQHPGLLYDTLGNVTGTDADFQTYLQTADKKEAFAERAGLPLIRFCLATVGPDGQPTDGIVQPVVVPRIWGVSDSICRSGLGGSDAWNPTRYCNIWVARLAENNAGYAQMPGGPAETDGIVIDDRFFASAVADTNNPHYLGRTLTHLMGSYLNLYELWNDIYPCADDYVDDTPIHNAPNYQIATYKHVSTCFEDEKPVEMTMNLMDNTQDVGQYMFTWGQVMRMQATLAENGPRGSLRYTSSDCSTVAQRNAQDHIGEDPANAVEMSMRIFPNPTADNFTIEIQSSQEASADLRIFNALGEDIYQRLENLRVGMTIFYVNTARWSPGLYTVAVFFADRRMAQKVLLEK